MLSRFQTANRLIFCQYSRLTTSKLSSLTISTSTSGINSIRSSTGGRFYEELRAQQQRYHPHLLMARVGDFYEFYWDQARTVSTTLGFKLATVSHGRQSASATSNRESSAASISQPTVMCGFPAYRLNEYVRQLLSRGFSIAKYEQYDQLQRNNDRIIVRRVDRIYTAGTVVEEDLVGEDAIDRDNYLMAVDLTSDSSDGDDESAVGFACVDLATGRFYLDSCSKQSLPHKLAFIRPAELLVSTELSPTDGTWLLGLWQQANAHSTAASGSFQQLTEQPEHTFNDLPALERHLSRLFQSDKRQQQPTHWLNDRFIPSGLPRESLRACSSLINYILESHSGALPLLNRPQRFDADVMAIDGETQKSLELLRSSRRGEQSRSLFHYLDGTVTPFGRRLLSTRLRAPAISVAEIKRRHDLVQLFHGCPELTDDIRQVLGQYCRHDLIRAVQNLRYNNGGPWHLGCVLAVVHGIERLKSFIAQRNFDGAPLIDRLRSLTSQLEGLQSDSLVELITSVLPGVSSAEGMTMDQLAQLPRQWDRQQSWLRPDCNQDLLSAKQQHEQLLNRKSEMIEQLRLALLQSTPTTTKSANNDGDAKTILGVNFESKKPLGAYVEIETTNTAPLPKHHDQSFRHLQTLGGSSKLRRHRYRYAPWSELDRELSATFDRYLDIERQVFRYVCEQIYLRRQQLVQCVSALAEIDVSTGLALKAREYQLVRPEMTAGTEFSVDGGRHPVVERFLTREAKHFQSNNCHLAADGKQMILLTGPNMGGKSTYLRQNAVISIMAQMGSFVPARRAVLGIVDRLFSRVGSSDDLSRSQSSFMVEMNETAFILQRATSRSLIIMDEVGRGTSASDGKAIAWGVICYLSQQIGARCLFATHFYDLAELLEADGLPGIQCLQTKIISSPQSVVFTHQIEQGVCTDSHGIHIARMAGVPEKVLEIAER